MQGQPIRETTLALLVERFSDFGELYMNLEEAKEVVGSSSDKFEEYFTRNLSQVLTWQVPHGFKIKGGICVTILWDNEPPH